MCPSGQLDQAATWLLENAENMVGNPRARADSGSSSHSAPLSGVEVKAESVCICFIDDCLDCDIPLAELTFSSKSNTYICIIKHMMKFGELFVFTGIVIMMKDYKAQDPNCILPQCSVLSK